MLAQSVTVVVPVFAGADHLRPLVVAISDVRAQLLADYIPVEISRVVLVLDEPRDDSEAVAIELAADHEWVDVITLSKNFGQHPATVAGILHTSSDWVATIDEDLQHPPAELTTMLAKAVLESADLVYGCPDSAVHGGWRDLASQRAKLLVSWISGIEEARSFNSFRLIRGSIARAAASVAGHETYFDVALTWHTHRIVRHTTKQVDTRPDSGYTFRSLLSHMRRLIISSDAKALRIGAAMGIVGVGVASIALIWFALGTIFDFRTAERGWLSIITAVVFFGGVLTLTTSLLSEYVLNIAQRVQGRPTFYTVNRSADVDLREWAQRELA